MAMRDVSGCNRLAILAFGALVVPLGCGSSSDGGDLGLVDDSGPGGPGGLTVDGDPGGLHPDGDPGTGDGTPSCTGLACRRHTCAGTTTTTISGTVYDPAGKNPLYDVVVYIPNAPVKDLTLGASCDACDSLYSGSPIVSTLTDAAGKFTLTKAPDGADIPLVVQIGKWRKQFVIPSVAQCADTALPDRSITLPKNHAEPGSSIPNIAISTGGADTLECLLRRIGLDEAEYGPGASARAASTSSPVPARAAAAAACRTPRPPRRRAPTRCGTRPPT
ncbi:MAG: hypothetical protein NVS3B10_28340 [Polyangiales bacterium]